MIYYHLVSEQKNKNSEVGLKKIIDYLLTFPGDIQVSPDQKGSATISYTETPLVATLKTTGKLNRQITLTCEENDNISVNLLKNVTKNIGYRIFNPQTLSYLVNDPTVLDLTTANVDDKILKIIKKYGLTPLFQYRDSLVFYAKDKKGKIYLINRHLLEHLLQDKKKNVLQKDFGVEVAPDIGRFVALFDRGLVPVSFYENYNKPTKIINLSGFDTDGFERNVFIEPVFFVFDAPTQSFRQLDLTRRDLLSRGQKLNNHIRKVVRDSKLQNKLMAAKLARDISYITDQKEKLVPRLRLSLFLDE